MEHLWIQFAVAAAVFQTLRLAGLKQANQSLSALVATLVRSLFGLPVLLVYLAALLALTGSPLPALTWPVLALCTVAGLAQFAGTALLVHAYQLRNFAVGTMLVKTDVIITALIGTAFFSERISALGWVALALTVVGVMVVSLARLERGALTSSTDGLGGLIFGYATRVCLASATVFSLSYLTLREAVLTLEGGAAMRAGYAGVLMTATQLALVGPWLAWRDLDGVRAIGRVKGLAAFVGLMSALGTIFWFLASALANAAYVAAVAQVQVVLALLISALYFKEAINAREIAGMAIIVAGIVMFRFV